MRARARGWCFRLSGNRLHLTRKRHLAEQLAQRPLSGGGISLWQLALWVACAGAAEALREFLLDLWSHKRLTDKETSTLCWHISRAGGAGVADLGVDPDSRGANHARALERALALKDRRGVGARLCPGSTPLCCGRSSRLRPGGLAEQTVSAACCGHGRPQPAAMALAWHRRCSKVADAECPRWSLEAI